MESAQRFSFGVEWNYKTVSLFLFLMILPNFLGLMNIKTVWGFNIHFFQIAVFIAAAVCGPIGGMLSGLVGSAYSAFAMTNPYILVGNALLGFFVGLFVRYGFHMIVAVLMAYLIQLLWLVPTDYYLVHLPMSFIKPLIVTLAVSNIVWAVAAHYSVKPIKKSLGC